MTWMGLRQIISDHKELPAEPIFANILFEYSTSLDMAKLLVEHGLAVKSISDNTISYRLRYLSRYKMALIDFFAKEGMQPLFTGLLKNDPNPTIEFRGCTNEYYAYSLWHYPDFPHIKSACHQFLLSKFEPQDQKRVQVILNHCSMYGDPEGMDLILKEVNKYLAGEKNNPAYSLDEICMKAALRCIEFNQTACLEVILKHIPLERFSPDNQNQLFSKAKQMGFIHIEELLANQGLPAVSLDPSYVKKHKEWDQSLAEKLYPAWQRYTSFNKSLNQAHRQIYGDEAVQAALLSRRY